MGVGLETVFAVGLGVVDPHPSGGVDDAPRTAVLQNPADRAWLGQRELAARGQAVVDPTPLAGPRQRLAECAGGADDQERPRSRRRGAHLWLRLGRVDGAEDGAEGEADVA